MDNDKKSCKELWAEKKNDRVASVRRLFRLGETTGDYEEFWDYALGFEYVSGLQYTAGSSTRQDEGYYRWQLEWGGPASEFRFYTDARNNLHRIEFVYLDWWDGHARRLVGRDAELLTEVWDFFVECGSVRSAMVEETID
jgi:hypothetical protein